MYSVYWLSLVFFFQAEDGIRDAQESRGLGDVYKRQVLVHPDWRVLGAVFGAAALVALASWVVCRYALKELSLIHI